MIYSDTTPSAVVPTANNYEKATYNLAEITDYLHMTGRSAIAKDSTGSKDGLLFDYAAQGLLFRADCEGDVTLSLELSMREQDKEGLHYYTIYIDGVKQDRASANGIAGSTVLTELKVASGLERGIHNIEVYRNHEALAGIATLLTVTMNGAPLKWENDPDKLHIEFLGDSVSSGACLYSTGTTTNIKYSDGTASYAFVASRLLNAEASVVSRSGMTAAGDTGEPNMYNYYTNLSYERSKTTPFDNTKVNTDLFVISLGANDTNHIYNHSAEKLNTDAKAALTQIRKDHPNTKILWVYGQLTNDKKEAIESAVEAMGGEAKDFYFYCCKIPNTDGGWSHPNAAAQQRDGEEVAEVIKQILNLK